jgi:FkbM family methyltransferase
MGTLRGFFAEVDAYSRHYGALRAYGLTASTKWKNKIGRGLFSVKLPDIPHPIWLRSGTSDLWTFKQVFAHRDYSIQSAPQHRLLRDRYDGLVASGCRPLIIDCGANIGLSALWFASQYPKARIIAVEPHPGNFELLSRNAKPYLGIEVVQGAVWGQPHRLSISNPNAEHWRYRVQSNEAGDVRAYSFNELAGEDDVFIAKLDIEGSERQVFEGNTQWVDKTGVIVVEFHDWMLPGEATSTACLSAVMRRPFDLLVQGENIFFVFRNGTDQKFVPFHNGPAAS